MCCGVSRVWAAGRVCSNNTRNGSFGLLSILTMILGYYSEGRVCVRLALQIKLHVHLWSCIYFKLSMDSPPTAPTPLDCCYDGAVMFGHPEPEWGRLRCGEGRCCQDHSVERSLWSNTKIARSTVQILRLGTGLHDNTAIMLSRCITIIVLLQILQPSQCRPQDQEGRWKCSDNTDAS